MPLKLAHIGLNDKVGGGLDPDHPYRLAGVTAGQLKASGIKLRRDLGDPVKLRRLFDNIGRHVYIFRLGCKKKILPADITVFRYKHRVRAQPLATQLETTAHGLEHAHDHNKYHYGQLHKGAFGCFFLPELYPDECTLPDTLLRRIAGAIQYVFAVTCAQQKLVDPRAA